MTYEEYIASTLWRDKRALALERDKFRCRLCNSPDSLEVHHRSYGPELGAETIDDLTTLCRDCHDIATTIIRRRRYASVKVAIIDIPNRDVARAGTCRIPRAETSDRRNGTPRDALRPAREPDVGGFERAAKNIEEKG